MPLTGSFSGKDLLVTWSRNPANNRPGIVFKDYEVKVKVGTTLLRTEYVVNPTYTYYYDDMIGDQGVNPSRSIVIEVVERDTLNRVSAPAIATFTNPAPGAPSFTVNPGFTTARIQIGAPADNDIAGFMVCRSTTSGFTPSVGNLVYKGPDNNFVDAGLAEGVTYFYRVAAYDLFNDDLASQTFSSQLSTTTVTVTAQLIDYEFQNIIFTPNALTNVLSWTAGTAIRTRNGIVTTFTTPSGNATWTTGTLYIVYDGSDNTITSTTSLTTALSSTDRRILASYKGGRNVIDGTNEPIVDGSKIIANTIGASQLVTNAAVITGTAQIANAVIETANIKDLTVERLKIANGAVTNFIDFEEVYSPALVFNDTSNTWVYPGAAGIRYNWGTNPNLIPDELLILQWESNDSLGQWVAGSVGAVGASFSTRGVVEAYNSSGVFIEEVVDYTTQLQNSSWGAVSGVNVVQEVGASQRGAPFSSVVSIPRFRGAVDRFQPGGYLDFFSGYRGQSTNAARYRYQVTVDSIRWQFVEIFK